jgi:DNA (cytosine-5)-methyltransferase 1
MDTNPIALRALAHFDALFPEEPPLEDSHSGTPPTSELFAAIPDQPVDTQCPANTISNMMISPSGLAVDLFCGCGGISEGLRLAGYDVRAGVDIEQKYIQSFRHNFPDTHAITDSILECPPELFSRRVGIEQEELAILVGGPPCQGFSKNVPRRYRYLEDPKNQLVRTYLDYVEFFRPEIVLMENVAEMKNGFEGQYTTEVLERLDRAGYTVTHAVLNAADYGVPQRRRRAFFMANRAGVRFSVPQRTHAPNRTENALFSFEESHVSVWEAIGDLPTLDHGDAWDGPYSQPATSSYQKRARAGSKRLRNHVARTLQPTQLARYNSLLPGQGNKDLPPDLRSKGGYSGAYGRLTKDMVAPTITRWVFHPGSGRWGHPVDMRVLSIREVARVQGFPDTFEFVGSYNDQAGQLGNAVPPLLAATIVSDLRKQLQIHAASRSLRSVSKSILDSGLGKSNFMQCSPEVGHHSFSPVK